MIRKINRTTMAAAVFISNKRSGKSDHWKIWTGIAVAGSVIPVGISRMNANIPIINSGAVSPKACAIPMMVPVRMPGIANGKTWCDTVCTFEAPTPRAAWRIDGGTALIAARDAMMIVGRVISASTIPPAKAGA